MKTNARLNSSRKIRERDLDPLSSSLSLEKKRLSVFFLSLSSFTSETTRERGTIRAREEILKERVKERENFVFNFL